MCMCMCVMVVVVGGVLRATDCVVPHEWAMGHEPGFRTSA